MGTPTSSFADAWTVLIGRYKRVSTAFHLREEMTPEAYRHAGLEAILHMRQASVRNLTVLIVGHVAISNALKALDL